jgi:hypothetical protein
MSQELIGLVGDGHTCDIDMNLYHVIFAGSYVPLDADPEVIKHYHGGQSSTQNVYIAIDINEWNKFLSFMRKQYPKIAMKHIGRRYMNLAKKGIELEHDEEMNLSNKVESFIKEFKETAISTLSSMSPVYNRYFESVQKDVVASRAYSKAYYAANRDKRLTTVDYNRCDLHIRMEYTLNCYWNIIADVEDYREPWNK